MRGGFRGGRSYHPGNRPTLSPSPPQKPLAWFPRLKPPREREAGSRLYARLIGESGTRCADWHPHKAAISPPGLYIDVCASSIANRPRVFSLPPPGCSLELFTATTWRRSWFNPGGSSSAMILCFLVEKMGNAFSCGATDYKFSHRKSRLWIWIWI